MFPQTKPQPTIGTVQTPGFTGLDFGEGKIPLHLLGRPTGTYSNFGQYWRFELVTAADLALQDNPVATFELSACGTDTVGTIFMQAINLFTESQLGSYRLAAPSGESAVRENATAGQTALEVFLTHHSL